MVATDGDADRLIRDWFAAALAAVDPNAAVAGVLAYDGKALTVAGKHLPLRGRVIVVGVGKASVPMALGVESVCRDAIADGLVITKDGHAAGDKPRVVRVAEAAHPIPDERGVRATREILEMLEGVDEDDVVIALISGGGSALLEAPRPPVTLDDLARTTDLLLKAGAPIQDLNRVRTPLSLVKGGGLRRAAGRATMVTLILSDVLGNDTRIIASGPTVPAQSTAADALRIIERYKVGDRVPTSVHDALAAMSSDELRVEATNDVLEIVADNALAVRAVMDRIASDGYQAKQIWSAIDGEAAELGRKWVEECLQASEDVDVLIGGGEATVTVRGDGVGGRNTEFALAAALALENVRSAGWVVASLATDGQDGPTNVAGAIADHATCVRARAALVSPETALAENDSLRIFQVAGGVVNPGPTGTNVNDLYFAVRVGDRSEDVEAR